MFCYIYTNNEYVLAHEYLYWTSMIFKVPLSISKITVDNLKSIVTKYSSTIQNNYEIILTNEEEIKSLVEELNILSKLMGGK